MVVINIVYYPIVLYQTHSSTLVFCYFHGNMECLNPIKSPQESHSDIVHVVLHPQTKAQVLSHTHKQVSNTQQTYVYMCMLLSTNTHTHTHVPRMHTHRYTHTHSQTNKHTTHSHTCKHAPEIRTSSSQNHSMYRKFTISDFYSHIHKLV